MADKIDKVEDPAQGNPPQPVPEIQQKSSQNDPVQPPTPAPPVDMIPKSEVEKLLEKARSEEKQKLYPDLERLKEYKTKTEERIKSMEEQLETRQRELEDVRAGKVEEKESINRELRELREQNKKLESAIDGVADAAAMRVRQSELNSYRERKIREAGLKTLTDLVKGETEADIDASIQSAMEKEQAIFEMAREEVRKAQAKDLPQPLSPDGSQGRGPTSIVNPKDKERISRLKGDDYLKVRDQLLQEAKQKAGL